MKINDLFKCIKNSNRLNKIFGQHQYSVCFDADNLKWNFKTLTRFQDWLIFCVERSTYHLIMKYNFYDLEKANDFGEFKIYIIIDG